MTAIDAMLSNDTNTLVNHNSDNLNCPNEEGITWHERTAKNLATHIIVIYEKYIRNLHHHRLYDCEQKCCKPSL